MRKKHHLNHSTSMAFFKQCILAILLIVPLCAFAQKKTFFTLQMKDKISMRSLGSAHVSIFDADSTLLDTCMVVKRNIGNITSYLYMGEVESNSPYFWINIDRKGYQPRTIKVMGDKKGIEMYDIVLEREIQERTLGTATVQASKIMMVMKGDTIVYNADAFDLSEGSMLDKLISCLPGVELKPGGVITINGNPVKSLLLNGKDFFKGDPSIALENLPAYTVDKIKAYQKAPDDAYITRNSNKARPDDPWVIDVNLKKDYNKGWLVNAEAAAGTEDRFLGKLFAMRFTDRTKLFVFGNANNLNDTSKPGNDGNWEKQQSLDGRRTTQTGGVEFGYSSKDNRTQLSLSLTGKHGNTLSDLQTTSTSFRPSGDTYGRERLWSRQKNDGFNFNGSLTLPLKKAYIYWNFFTSYDKTSQRADQLTALFNKEPFESHRLASLDSLFSSVGYRPTTSLVNYSRDLSTDEKTRWNYATALESSISMPGDKSITALVNMGYIDERRTMFSQYDLHTPAAQTENDFRNRHSASPNYEFTISGVLDYQFFKTEGKKLNTNIFLSYHSEYNRQSGGTTWHRLDSLNSGWNTANGHPLGMLPSSTDSLTACVDWANTFHTTQSTIKHNPQLRFYLYGGAFSSISLELRTAFQRDKVDDLRRRDQRLTANKSYAFFNPGLMVSFTNGIRFEAWLNHNTPTRTYLLDVRDDSNPLSIWRGNPNLKAAEVLSMQAAYSKDNEKLFQSYWVGALYTRTQHAIGQLVQYDTRTGVTTVMPENINGNWDINVNAGYSKAFGKGQRWQFQTEGNTRYANSVDFQQDVVTNESTPTKSTVHNVQTDATASMRYRQKEFNVGFKAATIWQHATSSRENFTTVNSWNVLYTLTSQVNLPWDVDFNSDITLYSRYGYADHSMNTNEWIWNASIEKRLLKNKALTVRITGFDILAQRSNIQRTLNEQGRTETWSNTIPRYFLLSLIYRFHKSPKRNYD